MLFSLEKNYYLYISTKLGEHICGGYVGPALMEDRVGYGEEKGRNEMEGSQRRCWNGGTKDMRDKPSRKRIQNNDSEDDPGPQKKNGGKD